MNSRAKKMLPRKMAVVALMVLGSLGLAAIQFQVNANQSGYTGGSTSGCGCHGHNPSSGVNVSITGLPTEYTPATTYPLTVKVTGGPSPGGVSQGGFDLAASSGVLAVPQGSSSVQILSGEATHTTAGNKQRQWNVDWTTPAQGTGTVKFNVVGLSANGDGAKTGDPWNTANYSVTEKNLVDIVRPTIAISAPTEGQQFPQGTVQVQASGTASDNVGVTSVEVSTDGANWQPATGTTSWTSTVTVATGSNTIQARAKDAANNIGTAKVNLTVKAPPADTQRPNITITAPAEGRTFPVGTAQMNISGTASDNVGVTLVEVSIDGIVWASASGTGAWSAKLAVQSGKNTLHARARDAAANIRESQVNITVNVSAGDSVPPEVHITAPTVGQVLPANTTLFDVQGSASDNVAVQKVEASTDGTTWAPAAGTTAWSAQVQVKTGSNTVHARATDTSGNTYMEMVTFSVAVPPDTTRPALTIDGPAEGTSFPFATKSIEVQGKAQDDKGVKEVRFSVNGTAFQKASGNTNWSFMLSVTPGSYHISVEAEDLSKNVNSRKVNFTVQQDTTTPLLLISSHSNGATLPAGTKTITLAGMASDNGTVQNVEVSSDNSTWVPATGTTAWSAAMKVSPGKNTLYVRATDASGNVAYAKVDINVLVAKQNLWLIHVVLLVLALIVALTLWAMGWRIRRDKTKRSPQQKARRRKLHILVGPMFSTILISGFLGGLINRYLIRGVVLTSPHGYLSLISVVFYLLGSITGTYMALKRPTDALRRAHVIFETGGTVFIILAIVEGIRLTLQLKLL
jgi:hypothetical protein